MLTLSAALAAHLGQQYQTLCTVIRIERVDGQIFGYTDHDADVDYNDGDGSLTYLSAVGYRPKDSAQAGDMTVDDTEYEGILSSPSITESDLKAGLWDYAGIRVSYINWVDPTMGGLRLPGWKIGKVSLKRDEFAAEIRGIMQAYQMTLGELTQPGCRANLGDARCKVDLSGTTADTAGLDLTVTGILEGVSADGMTLYDSARTEPGPIGGIGILSISKANPGVVTLDSGGGANFTDGQPITLSGCSAGDFATLNTNTFIRSLSGDTFHLGISTAAFAGTYSADSGSVTPLGGTSGFFDFGICRSTSGANNGLSRDVLSYVPGQWTLQEPFPYPFVIGGTAGDTYTLVAGCDKTLPTCRDRFANTANMRAEPYLPGIDQMLSVGKQ